MNTLPDVKDRREAVLRLIKAFVEVWPGSDYGPAHIVLSDDNLLDDNLSFCYELIQGLLESRSQLKLDDDYKGHSTRELAATSSLLDILRLIPEEWRDIHAEDEGGEDV